MKIVFFVHSLLSDWNHGNAHFLRGVATELQARGHEVVAYEPADSWSAANLAADHGEAALDETRRIYPHLPVRRYHPAAFADEEALEDALSGALAGADLVIVHEWNDHALVRRIGEQRPGARFLLLFHDTHHRSVSAPGEMAAYELRDYDGVLAFGEPIRERYLRSGWAARAWTWHEAADTRVFHPRPGAIPTRDLVWIGNWGDGERTAELEAFLIRPVEALGLAATVHGVRYPAEAIARLQRAGISYDGWVANYAVPATFAQHRVTVHVPRRPYVQALPGIPTIRPFEALACGIPLVSAPWDDTEALFRPGVDYLVARDGHDMRRQLRAVLNDAGLAASLSAAGRDSILTRHTCAHRVDELLAICAELRPALVENAVSL